MVGAMNDEKPSGLLLLWTLILFLLLMTPVVVWVLGL
jgi:hypothetical protein